MNNIDNKDLNLKNKQFFFIKTKCLPITVADINMEFCMK